MSRVWVAAAVLLAACGQQAGGGGSGIVSGAEPGIGRGGGAATDAGQPPVPGTDGGTLACVPSANVLANAGSGGNGSSCSELLPVLGAPVEHRYTEIFNDPDADRRCAIGAYPSSGTGVVPHRTLTASGPAVYLADASGVTVGEFGSPRTSSLDFLPQDTGFAVRTDYTGALGDLPLYFISDHGSELTGSFRTVNAGAEPWPGGGVLTGESELLVGAARPPGCADASEVGARFRLTRWDPSGNVIAGPSAAFECFDQERVQAIFRTNSSGWTLLFIYGGPSETTRTWTAYWLDPALNVSSTWVPVGLPTDGPYPGGELTQTGVLLDDSIVIAVNGVWSFRVPSQATALEPAPCWLTRRNETELEIVGGRRGYALLTTKSGQSCDQLLEVVTADGTRCGFLELDTAADACGHGVAVGRDGTISVSAYAEDAGSGQPKTCVQPFWPAALGRSRW